MSGKLSVRAQQQGAGAECWPPASETLSPGSPLCKPLPGSLSGTLPGCLPEPLAAMGEVRCRRRAICSPSPGLSGFCPQLCAEIAAPFGVDALPCWATRSELIGYWPNVKGSQKAKDGRRPVGARTILQRASGFSAADLRQHRLGEGPAPGGFRIPTQPCHASLPRLPENPAPPDSDSGL